MYIFFFFSIIIPFPKSAFSQKETLKHILVKWWFLFGCRNKGVATLNVWLAKFSEFWGLGDFKKNIPKIATFYNHYEYKMFCLFVLSFKYDTIVVVSKEIFFLLLCLIRERERGDDGLFNTLVPKVL